MYIVHVGASYFPSGNAAVQRIRFTYRAVQAAGFRPLIINKEFNEEKPRAKRVNKFDGIPFVFTPSSLRKPANKVSRQRQHYSGVLGELKLLFKRRKKIASLILYNTSSFSELLYYRIVSKLFGFKMVFQYVEYRSSFAKKSFTERLNDKIFDNYCSYFADGVIVISEFLKEKIQKKNNKLPLIKLPVICDFEEFTPVKPANPGYNYFLYCGTSNYLDVIYFNMELYEKARKQNLYNGKLVLVIGVADSSGLINELEQKIKSSTYANDIVFYKNLPYKEILPLYKSADLLMIPLRNTIQDIARFPHKIAEYTASGKAFISSNIGEIKYYFKNGESAILADEYDVDLYMQSLAPVLKAGNELERIGKQGYRTGYNNFHYESNAAAVKIFFEKLCSLQYSKMAIAGA